MYLMEPINPLRIQFARHLLSIYDIITPGLTKERGLTLFEVHSGLLRQIKAAIRETIKPENLRALLDQCQESLSAGNQALKCLQNENEDSFESQIFHLLTKTTSHCKDIHDSLLTSISSRKYVWKEWFNKDERFCENGSISCDIFSCYCCLARQASFLVCSVIFLGLCRSTSALQSRTCFRKLWQPFLCQLNTV